MVKNPQSATAGGQKENNFHILNDDKFQKLQKQAGGKTKKTKDDWRSIFALIILSGHFLLVGTVVGAWLFGKDTDSAIQVLSAVGSLLGSPLGFVIGYYYKDRSK